MSSTVMGIKYMDGYGVVAKDSKEHKRLRSIRMAVVDEYPITYLRHIKSVINKAQIKAIWGADIYRCYLEHEARLEKQPEALKEVVEQPRCCAVKSDGNKCKSAALKDFKHCRVHIEMDEKIKPFIQDMKMMPVKEKRKFITEVIQKARG